MSVYYIGYNIVKPLTMEEIKKLVQCYQSKTPLENLEKMEEEFIAEMATPTQFSLEAQARKLEKKNEFTASKIKISKW